MRKVMQSTDFEGEEFEGRLLGAKEGNGSVEDLVYDLAVEDFFDIFVSEDSEHEG